MADRTEINSNLEYVSKGKTAVHRTPGTTLADTLGVKSTTALKKLASGFRIRGYTKLDRNGLIKAVGNELLDPGRMEEVIYILDSSIWDLFERLAGMVCLSDDTIDFSDYDFLQFLGYVQSYYFEGHYHYVMPCEVRNVYAALKKNGIVSRKQRAELLHHYAAAATELYGVISQDDFVALFNRQNTESTSIDEVFQTLLRQIIAERASYCLWDEYIVNEEFEEDDFEGVEALLRLVGDKPRYIPHKQELLKYADPDYYEQTPATRALHSYLVKEFELDADFAQTLVEILYYECAAGNSMADLLDLFNDEDDEPLTMAQFQTLAELIADFSNNTRLWSNNGHTPNEILAQFERQTPRPLPADQAKTKKTGRNEPCPCGSGKKYKKCCGR